MAEINCQLAEVIVHNKASSRFTPVSIEAHCFVMYAAAASLPTYTNVHECGSNCE